MMLFDYPEEQRRLNEKVIDALRDMGIVFDRSYSDLGWICYPYEKYVYYNILFYVGALSKIMNAVEGKEDVPSPDLSLINKIYDHFWNSGDPELRKVAYNTFFDFGYNGMIPSFPIRLNGGEGQEGGKDDILCLSWNRSEPFSSGRLLISPMDDKARKEMGEHLSYEETPLFVGYMKNLSFSIFRDGKMVGGIALYPLSLAYEVVYSLDVHIKEEYRGNGYGKEAVDALMKRLDEGKIVLYGDMDYRLLYEEFAVSPSLVRAYVDIENPYGVRMMDGTIFEKEGVLLMKEGDGYRKKASYYHLVKRK